MQLLILFGSCSSTLFSPIYGCRLESKSERDKLKICFHLYMLRWLKLWWYITNDGLLIIQFRATDRKPGGTFMWLHTAELSPVKELGVIAEDMFSQHHPKNERTERWSAEPLDPRDTEHRWPGLRYREDGYVGWRSDTIITKVPLKYKLLGGA